MRFEAGRFKSDGVTQFLAWSDQAAQFHPEIPCTYEVESLYEECKEINGWEDGSYGGKDWEPWPLPGNPWEWIDKPGWCAVEGETKEQLEREGEEWRERNPI